MEKLKMHTPNLADENFRKLAELFPNAVTESINADGEVVRVIDKDVLMQEISTKVVEGREERYQFTWPDKKKSMLLANSPIAATLRPCREESVNFDTTENLYIEGDNLDVLKLLRETYLGKVKMIYIDPPYNTGKDFVYEDDFSEETGLFLKRDEQYDEQGCRLTQNLDSNGRFHTNWLNMLYPRLKLAKDLLKDDGVLFVSIDDNEEDNLKKCCDEVIGRSNYIAKIIHKNNSMKNQSKFIGVSTEYVFIYAKNLQNLSDVEGTWRIKKKGAADINSVFVRLKEKGYSLEEIREEIMEMYSRSKYSHLSRWNKVDEFGVFKDSDLSRSNGPKDYTIINPNTNKPCIVPNRGWGKSYNELLRLQRENMIWYGDENTPPGMKSYLTEESESVPDNFLFADTASDKKEISGMFGSTVFEFPKSLELMKHLISLGMSSGEVVIDFFSGSATTAHAVMQLNAEDGGKRKFIMVQLPEITDENSEAYKAGYKNICEIGKERIRRAGAKIKAENPLTTTNLDNGFRVLKLDSSNMKDVYYNPSAYTPDLFDELTNNIKEDRTPEDLLFQVMLELGIELSSKIVETIVAGKKVFNIAGGFLLACFDEAITDEVITEIAKQKPYYFVMRDSSLADDSVAANFDQIFDTYSSKTIRKVL